MSSKQASGAGLLLPVASNPPRFVAGLPLVFNETAEGRVQGLDGRLVLGAELGHIGAAVVELVLRRRREGKKGGG